MSNISDFQENFNLQSTRPAHKRELCELVETPENPHPDNMGVSFVNDRGADNFPTLTHIDYLTLTAWEQDWGFIWDNFLFPYLDAEIINQGHGGRFYKETWRSLLGVTIRDIPAVRDENGKHWTLELPGKACEIIGFEGLKALYQYLCKNSMRVKVNRIDLAIDYCNFKPVQVYQAIRDNQIRTSTHRESLGFRENPYEKAENGRKGTQICYFGSRDSGRYMRCYDLHGFTRLEVEYKHDWANKIAADLFSDGDIWKITVSYLRDFIDLLDENIDLIRENEGTRANLESHLLSFWSELVQGIGRAAVKLAKTAKEITIERVVNWLEKQVSSAYSVVIDYGGYTREQLSNRLLEIGQSKRENSLTYAPLLVRV